MPLFDAEYLRNGARYRHSYNEILKGIHTLVKGVILNDLEKLSEIFDDTNHRTVSATAQLLVAQNIPKDKVLQQDMLSVTISPF